MITLTLQTYLDLVNENHALDGARIRAQQAATAALAVKRMIDAKARELESENKRLRKQVTELKRVAILSDE